MISDRVKTHQKALLISYLSVGYNIVEEIVSIFAGVLADSIALIGFGLDSFVESLSGGVMVWRFRNYGKMSEEEEESPLSFEHDSSSMLRY